MIDVCYVFIVCVIVDGMSVRVVLVASLIVLVRVEGSLCGSVKIAFLL